MNKLKLYITGIVGIVSVSLIAFLASGCGNGDTDPTGLVDTWDMTQTIVIVATAPIDTLTPDVDTVSGTVTFNDDSTCSYDLVIKHTFTIGPTAIPVDTAISSSGDWSSTDSSFTINDPQSGELTFLYEISGNTMVTTGTIEIDIQGNLVPFTVIQTWKRQ